MTPTLTRTVNDHTCKPTAREHQIWQLLATTGDSNKELAGRMGIAPGTALCASGTDNGEVGGARTGEVDSAVVGRATEWTQIELPTLPAMPPNPSAPPLSSPTSATTGEAGEPGLQGR